VEPSPTAGEGCTYEICPSASSICRIRYDFTEHTLAGPVLVTNQFADAAAAANSYLAGASGHCTSDSFSIINSGGASSPIICGENKGQHMVLDSDGKGCHQAVFQLSSGTEIRKWEVHVTQFSCNDIEDTSAGPKGCLQYFTDNTGYIRSFNFPATTAQDLSAATHLANQHYSVCIKKNAEKTKACFTSVGGMAIANQITFGISAENGGEDTMVFGVTDSNCATDFISIPGGATLTIAAGVAGVTAAAEADVFRICGRGIGSAQTVLAAKVQTARDIDNNTFCTLKAPFTIKVHFDDSEVVTTIDKAMLTKTENIGSGSIGFGLVYAQT